MNWKEQRRHGLHPTQFCLIVLFFELANPLISGNPFFWGGVDVCAMCMSASYTRVFESRVDFGYFVHICTCAKGARTTQRAISQH
jgi:hypothetical protein